MLPDAENEQPDHHDAEGRRKKTYQQNAQSAQNVGQRRLPAGAKKKQNGRNKNYQKPRQFARKFHQTPLEVADEKRFVQKIIQRRIHNTLRKTENKRRRQKKAEIPRQIQNFVLGPCNNFPNLSPLISNAFHAAVWCFFTPSAGPSKKTTATCLYTLSSAKPGKGMYSLTHFL
jgi:hypothetical protein